MEDLWSAQSSIQECARDIVARHREKGVLTWRLLHQIESEVLDEVASSGRHQASVPNMLRAPAVLNYPKGDVAASFEGHDFVPPVFAAIDDAWRRLN